MINSTQAAQFVTAIYDPIDRTAFDEVVQLYGITIGIKKVGGVTVFAFPGTENNKDFVRDIQSVNGWSYHAHVGIVVDSFFQGMDKVIERLSPALKAAESMAITGHSLGCSHAIYLAMACIQSGIKINSLDLFAPPLSTSQPAITTILRSVERVRAFRNGDDPVTSLPFYLHQLGQFPFIKLNESPGFISRWIDVQWHQMKLYAQGVAKYEATQLKH